MILTAAIPVAVNRHLVTPPLHQTVPRVKKKRIAAVKSLKKIRCVQETPFKLFKHFLSHVISFFSIKLVFHFQKNAVMDLTNLIYVSSYYAILYSLKISNCP